MNNIALYEKIGLKLKEYLYILNNIFLFFGKRNRNRKQKQKIEEKINTFKYDSNLSAYENEKNMLKELKELRIMKAVFGNESNFGLIDIESLRSKKETDDEGNKQKLGSVPSSPELKLRFC